MDVLCFLVFFWILEKLREEGRGEEEGGSGEGEGRCRRKGEEKREGRGKRLEESRGREVGIVFFVFYWGSRRSFVRVVLGLFLWRLFTGVGVVFRIN